MTPDDEARHRHDFKNQLAIIAGFSELLLAQADERDPRRADYLEIHRAAAVALDLLGRVFPQSA